MIRSELGFRKTDVVSVGERTGQARTSILDIQVEVGTKGRICRWLRSATKAI